jgi:hypothetical protein
MMGHGRRVDLGGRFASRSTFLYKQKPYLPSSVCLITILPPAPHRCQRLGSLALAPPPPVEPSPLRLRSLMEPWCRSDIIHARMESLVKCGLLPARTEALVWVVLGDEDAPAPPDSYVVSFIPFHERRLTAPSPPSPLGAAASLQD